MTIQYDGTDFCGWQIQKDKRTVQGIIEKVLMVVFNFDKRISIYGSGRTDSGVHSSGQVAHFDFQPKFNCDIIQKSINSKLPEDCRIMKVEVVPHSFHSRYNAIKRLYKYQCYVGDSILNRNQSWLLKTLDISKLNKMSGLIKGEHDFLSFSKYDPNKNNTKSTIYSSFWKKSGDLFTYTISADRFLHHMIRYLVGTMLGVLKGHFSSNHFNSLLDKPRKNVQIHRAPACGLQLLKVEYD